MHWINTYPHEIHASVLLLDGKIENYKIGQSPKESPVEFRHFWKMDRLKDYESKTTSFTANSSEEHNRIFDKDALEWMKQWELADDYSLNNPFSRFKDESEVKRMEIQEIGYKEFKLSDGTIIRRSEEGVWGMKSEYGLTITTSAEDAADELALRLQQCIDTITKLESEKVELWSCSDCGFTFDASHTDVGTNEHSCPACAEIRLEQEVERLKDIESHWRMATLNTANKRAESELENESLRTDKEILETQLAQSYGMQNILRNQLEKAAEALSRLTNYLRGHKAYCHNAPFYHAESVLSHIQGKDDKQK